MLPTLAASLTREAVAGHDIAAVISSQYRARFARRHACRGDDGGWRKGPPPADYALLMLGSAARGESMLLADQDHAILFADADADASTGNTDASADEANSNGSSSLAGIFPTFWIWPASPIAGAA